RNIELRPVFKAVGDVSGGNERTSVMADRANAVAAVNAGYYNVTSGSPNISRTNSYTLIDGIYIGGASENPEYLAENHRSVIGFSGNHQEKAVRPQLARATGMPNPASLPQPYWPLITDAIGGRGHFTWNGSTYTMDFEATGESHYDARHP